MRAWSASAIEEAERSRRTAAALALVAAAAFTMSLVMFILARGLPVWIGGPMSATTRSFIVGSGGVLAATSVIAFYSALMRQAYIDSDPRPLVTMHPRRRG